MSLVLDLDQFMCSPPVFEADAASGSVAGVARSQAVSSTRPFSDVVFNPVALAASVLRLHIREWQRSWPNRISLAPSAG
jgi:hypothetical protein